jgi:hypothetical protein
VDIVVEGMRRQARALGSLRLVSLRCGACLRQWVATAVALRWRPSCPFCGAGRAQQVELTTERPIDG